MCEQKYHDRLWLNNVRQISLRPVQNAELMKDRRERAKQIGLLSTEVSDEPSGDDDDDSNSGGSYESLDVAPPPHLSSHRATSSIRCQRRCCEALLRLVPGTRAHALTARKSCECELRS